MANQTDGIQVALRQNFIDFCPCYYYGLAERFLGQVLIQ